jgi:hypothetical protein
VRHAASESNCREEFEIPYRRAFYRFKRDRGIEGGKSATVRYRKGEKVDVGELAMALNVIPVEPSRIAYADRAGPEHMLTNRTEGSQTCGCVLHRGAASGIRWIGQHPDQRVLSNCTSGPLAAAIRPEPDMRRFVMQMGGIEQRNQDVYVKQSDHAPSKVPPGAASRFLA